MLLTRRATTSDSAFSPRTKAAVDSTITIPPPPEAQSAFTKGIEVAQTYTKRRSYYHWRNPTTYWKTAASLGHVDATHALAVQALKQKNPALAYAYFRKAADAGHTDSCYQVGRLYLNGDGVEQDSVRGVEYLERAAEKQYAKAHRALGQFYNNVDQTKAVEHFNAAITHGDQASHTELGNLYHDMDEADLALAQYRLGVKRGDCKAMYCLGMCYVHGCCLPPDPKRATELLVAAGDQFSYAINFELAERFEHGNGVTQTPSAAILFYQFAWEAAVEDDKDLEAIHIVENALLRLNAPFDPSSGCLKNCLFRSVHHLASL